MDARTREHLRVIVAVALALVPRAVRRAYSDRNLSVSDAAKSQITAQIVEAVDHGFVVREKTDAEASASYRGGTTRRTP